MRVATLLGPDLKQLLRDDPQGIVELAKELHPEDVADVLRALSPSESARMLGLLPPAEAARIFERIDDHEQRDLMGLLARDRAVSLVAAMASDRRAKLFRILPEPARAPLLTELRASHSQAAYEINLIERWPEKSAGRLMTTSFVAVPLSSTVGEALLAMATHGGICNEPIDAAYALDDEGRLSAFARVRDFAPLDRDRPMADVWRTQLVTVPPETAQN